MTIHAEGPTDVVDRSAGRASGRRSGGWLIAAVSVLGAAAFVWPLWADMSATADTAHLGDAPWLMVLLVPLLVAVAVADASSGVLDAKAIAVMGVLAGAGAAMRLPTGGVGGTEMVFFLLLPAGRVLGRRFGFLLGAVTIFVSALLTGGIGPWLPFQLLGAAWIGFGAGMLPPAKGRLEVALLAAYGAGASMAFGALLNLWFWPFGAGYDTAVSFVPGDPLSDNLGRFWAFHLATSLGWDAMRAATTVVLCVVLLRPIIAALRRVSVKASFGASVEFR